MSLRKLKLFTILLPPMLIGGFEFIRHGFLLDYLSMEAGNFFITLMTLILSYLFAAWMFRNIERSNLHLAEEQTKRAVYEERERLAEELHDNLAQTLFFLNVKLKQGQLEESKEAVAEIDIQLRQAIFNLRTPPEAGTTLRERLLKWLHEWSLMTDIALSHHIDIADSSLKASEETLLFAIVQEAFTNIRKHSRATACSMALQADPTSIRMTIQDNGVGLQQRDPSRRQYGITLMRKRTEELGGAMELQSLDGQGTELSITVLKEPRHG